MGKSAKAPPVPGLTPQEEDSYNAQKDVYGRADKLLTQEVNNTVQNRGLLQQLSGLFDANGQINPQALADLRSRMTAEQGQAGSINKLQGDRLTRALNGESPVGATQLSDEKKQFASLQEQAARRGIRLKGNDLFTATSDSTAGNQMLAQLRNNAQMARERQVQSEIQTGYGNYTGSLGLGYQPQLGVMNAAQNVSAAPLVQGFMGLGQGYASAAQPFTDQRMAEYQRTVQNKANKRGNTMDLVRLGSGVAGGAATLYATKGIGQQPQQQGTDYMPTSMGYGRNRLNYSNLNAGGY